MTALASEVFRFPSLTRRPPDRKLCIICSKGSLDMAYPGLVLANTALGEELEVHLFFTFWGFDMINKKTMEHLKFTAGGKPGDPHAQPVMGLPGMTGFATHMMKKQMEGIEVPEVPEFLEMVTDAGGPLGLQDVASMMHLGDG